MGLSTIGGGGTAAAEVATSLPGRCFGAIGSFEEISGDLEEEDEEKFVL